MLRHFPLVGSCVLAAALVVACGDDDDDSGMATGGSKSSGGATAAGGSTAGTGAKGGGSSRGGASSGGASADGGNSANGGISSGGSESGGTTAELSGGAAGESTGGSGTGGAAHGGTSSYGGTTATETAGAGGSAGAGDTTGEGGSSGAPSAGAGGDATGEGGAGGAPTIQADTIDNPGFESGTSHATLPGWTTVGTADSSYVSYDQSKAYAGYGYLDNWLGSAYTVTTSQVVAPLPNGNYSFSIWHTGGAYTNQYVFARGYDSGDPSVEMKVVTTDSATWTQIVVSPIPVTSGQIEIGVYSDGAAENWSHFDNAVLTRLE